MKMGDVLSNRNASNGALKSNTDEAIRFLQALDSVGRHNLWAKDPETSKSEGRTFGPNSWDAIQRWIDARQGRMNIYFSVNEPKPGAPDDKLGKEEIGQARAYHCDIDPEKAEQQDPLNLSRLKAALEVKIKAVQKDPRAPWIGAIIDSGGGFNLLYPLDQKIPIASSEDVYAIEAQNRGLVAKFGGDPGTFNIDRVLRLPGTINLPDSIKRKRGRQAAVSRLVDLYMDEPTTPAEMEVWAPPIAPEQRPDTSKSKLDIDMEAIRACAIFDDLPSDLRTKFEVACKANNALLQLWEGDRRAGPGEDDSGSGYSWAFGALLKKAGGFSPTDFGQLLRVWDFSSADKSKINRRYVERAWLNSPDPKPSAGSEFHPLAARWITRFEASDLPRRVYVFGPFAAKRYVSVLVAPAGVGKTTFLLMMAVAVVTGRSDIAGFDVPRRERVFLYNQEDELDELKRRLLAVMAQFDVSWSDLLIDGQPGLVMESGAEQARIFARKDGDRVVGTKDAVGIEAFIKDNDIGLAIFDPFVEMHAVDENNNVEIAAVGRVFRRMAVTAPCSVVLAHHPRKPPNAANRESYAGDMDATRGAGALTGVTRMGATLYGVDSATAKKFGISEAEKHRYIRFDDGKANMSLLSGEPRFFRREGVVIGGPGGEEVGVLVPVKLSRVKSATQSGADENANIREAVASLLRRADGRRMTVKSVADELIDTGFAELVSPEALRKRLARMFEQPQTFENGDKVRSENAREKGKQGRAMHLIIDIGDTTT
ncbi:AAA family ATPase [Bradyrhizobium sp.]|jgi:hypothetical protein|uniref:AAA family ATPase n=1 Tax=Bradyrhizobium sp. TaxID=376 RepID=UPI002DDCE6B0|nr:AAA family ATPase [Bradyrhizobium sp.]HEV2153140.1 AAA family ATPase [Bradyrhizobium sp.]